MRTAHAYKPGVLPDAVVQLMYVVVWWVYRYFFSEMLLRTSLEATQCSTELEAKFSHARHPVYIISLWSALLWH